MFLLMKNNFHFKYSVHIDFVRVCHRMNGKFRLYPLWLEAVKIQNWNTLSGFKSRATKDTLEAEKCGVE